VGSNGGLQIFAQQKHQLSAVTNSVALSAATLYILDMPSKRGGNISFRRLLRLFISFKLIIFYAGNPLDSLRRTSFDYGSP